MRRAYEALVVPSESAIKRKGSIEMDMRKFAPTVEEAEVAVSH